MSQSGKRFLSGLFNRVKSAAVEQRTAKSRRVQTERRLGMEPLEERQLLAADPTLLSAFSAAQAEENVASVAPEATRAAIDVSSITVDDAVFSNATVSTLSSHVVNTDIAAMIDRVSADQQGWAASLANLLTYTGWSDNAVVVNPDSTETIEQQTFDYISNAFTNDQTSLYYAFGWYMGGASEYIYQGDASYAQIYPDNTDGGLFPATTGVYKNYSEYMKEVLAADIPSPLYGVTTEYLDNNYGVSIEIHYLSNATGSDVTVDTESQIAKKSWITLWGYEYDATYESTDVEYYTAIYASNPETGAIERMSIEWSNLLNSYVLTTYNQTTGQLPYMFAFDVLERMPGYGVLEPDAYEVNNNSYQAADLGQIDVITPSSTSGSSVYGNTFTLSDLTLYAEGDENTQADPVDYYKFELTQTASHSDSIVVQWADGVRNQNLKATLFQCIDGESYALDPADYGYVTGHFDSVASQSTEYSVGEDGKTYSKTINSLTITLAGLTEGEYFLKVEFADDVVSGVNSDYSITFNAGYDDIYETNNSFDEVNALPLSTQAAPTANLGVLYGTTELSDLVLKQYSNKVDETDWYRFEMTEAGTASNYIKLYYNSTAANINDADLDLYLYKLDESSSRGYTLVAKSYVEMTNIETISLEDVEAGIYYIKVVGNYSAGNVEYKLELNPGVSSIPDLRAEIPADSNWEAPLVVSSEKYVPNGSDTYNSDAVIGVDGYVYLNYSFTVNGASTKYGAAETAVYEGVRLSMYINGVEVAADDLEALIAQSSLTTTQKEKLIALFCSEDGVDMSAGETVLIRNLNLGRIVDDGSFAQKYFNNYSQATNAVVIAINPQNYEFSEGFGTVVDERETKEMTLTYKDGSFYNGATQISVSKGTSVEVYRNNRYLTDVVYGVDNFNFKDGDIILVSIVSHNYKVAVDGYYEVNDDVVGVLEYAVDNNFAAMFFTVTDLSEDAFAPNASVADVMANDNAEDCNPDLGYANIDNLEAYDTVGGEVLYHRVIDNLVITGAVNSNGAYTSDWFRFRLKTSIEDRVPNYENAFVEIKLDDTYSGLSETENLGDLDLYLYKVVQTDDTKSFEEAYADGDYRLVLIQSSKGVGTTEHIDFAGLDMTDGNYFICVSGFNGSANRYSMELGGFTKSGNIMPTDPSEYFTEDNVTILNSVATVKWEVPASDYVSSVNIQYRRVGSETWADAGSFKPSVTSCKVSGLASDTEYEFKLTVTNHFVEDAPLSATVTKKTESYLNETIYRAVIVGVSDYPGTSSDLVAAVNDAKAFRDALLADPQWASENILYLTDAEATRDSVLEALATVAAESDDNDVFVFYFAGSGTSAVVGGQDVGYLKTCGSTRSEFLSSTDLLRAVEQIAAGSKQFILDAGQISQTAEETGISYAPFVTSLTGSTVNGGSERVAQTTVLTSADATNVISAVGTGSRSVFNHALVDAMKEYSAVVTEEEAEAAAKADPTTDVVVSDGRVTFQEIFNSVALDERVVKYSVGVSVYSNETADATVLMSGEWNEADAYDEAWLEEGAIIVTTTVDSVDAHDGKISLREAAALVGTVLSKDTTVADNSTFVLKAGSVVTVGTTTGALVEDVEVTYLNGSFRTAEACSLQTATSVVEFNRSGIATGWTADDWNAGSVSLEDASGLAVKDVEFDLVAVSTDEEGLTTSVVLTEDDVLTTAADGGKQVVVKKVGQSYRLYLDDVLYTRTTGLYLNGEAVQISTVAEIAQDVTLTKVVFADNLVGQTLEIDASAGPIVFENGGLVYGSSDKGSITIDGAGKNTLIAVKGTELVSIVGVRMVNAKGSAVVVDSGASLELANVLLANTEAGSKGVIENNGVLYLTNNTIVANTTTGALVSGSGATTILNTIVALNTADLSGLDYDSTSVVTTTDPGFVDAENGDYQLLKTSSAIDIGQNSAVKLHCGAAILYDLAGNDRIGTASTVDAGAYEYTVALEDRETPSTIVTTLDDIVDATDNEISLREAIAYAGTTYEVETELQEGDVVTDANGVSYEVTNGKLISFDGVSGVQTGQYYAIEGVYLLDDFGQPTTLEEGDVVTLTNGTKATVVGSRLQLASGIPVEAGSAITTADGVTGTLAYGIATNFTRGDKISVNLTKAVIDPATPVADFDAGVYTLTYQANGTFAGTLSITTTENNVSTTTTFDVVLRLVDGTAFNFVDETGEVGEAGSIVTTRSVELEDGKYTLLEAITHKEGKTVVVDYAAGAILTLTRGVFTDADGVVVDVPKGTTFTSPAGMKVSYLYSNFSVASLEEGTELTDAEGNTKLYKEGLTLYEEVTLGTDITFKKGLESGTITLEKGAISIERAVTVDATLNGGLTIDAHNASRVFTVDTYREVNANAYVNLNGLTLVNGAANEGGFVYVAEGSNLRLSGSTLTGDGTQTSARGGAIYNAGRLVVESNTKAMEISGVNAAYGGAIYNVGAASVTGASISDVTGEFGGAIYNEGSATIAAATITGAEAKQGGAIYNAGTLSVSKTTELSGNTADYGAGVYNTGVATVVNSTISDNSALISGAGLYNSGKLTLSNVKVTDNDATIAGGAVYNKGQLSATRSLFAANAAGSNAAAIYNSGDASIASSLVIANGEGSASGRYTIYTKEGSLELVGDTIVGNAYNGVTVVSGAAKIYNTILGENGGVDLNAEGALDAQYSMVETSTSAIPSTNPTYAPNFSYFNKSADWTDWNLRLGSGSAAIGTGSLDYNYTTSFAGKKTAVTVDFAGNARVTDDGVDIGAYASNTVVEDYSTVVTTWDDIVDPTDGLVSLREAIRYASYGKTVAERTVTFSNDLFALTDSGVVTLDADLQSIVIDCAVTVTTAYTDALGQKQYRDVTVDGSAANATLFIIQNGADVEFDGLTFTGGHANGVNQNGGAFIIHGGEVTLLDSKVIGNSADRNGGAVYQDGGVLFVIDSLFSENAADTTRGYGGAICMNGGQAYIYNTTITANSAGVYGGVFELNGLVVLANSIVAKNGGAQNVDLYATNLEATNNLIGAMDPWSSRNGVNGNIVGVVTDPVDPQFTDFAGGDYTLASGSLAINAGVNQYAFGPDGVRLKYDLNANDRIVGGVVDLGAFESGFQDVPSTVVTTLADVIDQTDGLVSLREAIDYAAQLGTPITFDLGDDFAGAAEIRLDSLLGAIQVSSDLTIDASDVEGGLTIVGSDDRIFTLSKGTLKLDSVALTGGSATRGGAIYQTGGALDLTNVLIYGNDADEEGGAIYSVGGTITALNSTIAGNTAANVPGVYATGTVTLQNTIVADNAVENSVSEENYDLYAAGKLTSTASIVGATTDSVAASFNGYNGNVFGTVAAIVDAGFQGAGSNDYQLAQDSIAVNAGSNRLIGLPGYYASILQTSSNATVVSTDYAGADRLVGGTVDVGAYEYQVSTETPSVTVTTLEDVVDPFDGLISLREAIEYAGSAYYVDGVASKVGRTIDFAPELAGGTIQLVSGLEITKCVTIDATSLTSAITLTAAFAEEETAVVTLNGVADSVMDTITIAGLKITGGVADYGAGVYHVGGLANLVNCVVYGNEAAYGAGVASVADAIFGDEDANVLSLVNCTIANNNATGAYGGLWNRGSGIVIHNTIIAGNTVNGEVGIDANAGTVKSLLSSLIGVASNSFARTYNDSEGNYVGTASSPIDPSFTNVEENDFSLSRDASGAVSIAVNAGDTTLLTLPDGSVPTYDVNGNLRVIGSLVDIGAYESELGPTEIPSLMVTTLDDVVDPYDGLISLREALSYANNYGLASTITFASRLTGGTIYLNSSLEISNDITIDGLTNDVVGITLTTADDAIDQSVIYMNSGNAVINGLTITNRYTDHQRAGNELTVEKGGALYVRAGSISLYNSFITDSAAKSGSAIYINEESDSATVNLVNVTIAGNVGLTDNADDGAAIYCVGGLVNFWNTIVAKNSLSNGSQAQDVYKGTTNVSNDTVVNRASQSLNIQGSATDALVLENGGVVKYYGQTITYADGAYYYNYGTAYQTEATFADGDIVSVAKAKTLTYHSDGWYEGGVAYEINNLYSNTAQWTNSLNGKTYTVYYSNGEFRLNGSSIAFNVGDTLSFDAAVSYAWDGATNAFHEKYVTVSGSGWFRREYTLSQEAQAEYAQQILSILEWRLARQTTYTKKVNGVEISYPILSANVEISNYSAEVSASRGDEGGYNVEYTYVATYTYVTEMGVTVLHSLIGLSETVSTMASGNGSYVGSSTNDLSGVVDTMFTDAENGDYTLTNDSLATNAGDNSYFNQGTFNGTYDSLDIQGKRRIYYTTVDMGAFENQTAKDSPVSSVSGLTVNLTVTTRNDVVDSTDGVTSLREALTLANTLYSRGYQSIVINVSNAYNITVDSSLGSLTVNAPITLNANGATIDADLSGCGLIVNTDGEVVISNLIIKNGISGNGGGIKVTGGDLTLSNCLIYDSQAVSFGGGVYMGSDGVLNLYNTTIAKNVATSGSGVYACADATVNVYNSIIAKNRAAKAGADNYDVDFDGNFRVEYSLIGNAGTAADAANILAKSSNSKVGYGVDNEIDPVFMNESEGNFRLSATASPAKNAGSSARVYPGSYDLAGNYLGGSSTISMGAYQIGTETRSTIVTTLDDVVDSTDGLISLREAIAYASDCIAGAGSGSVDNSAYNATNAMNNASTYSATYYSPITFDASLAGGTIVLNSALTFNTTTSGYGSVYDTLIDASALAGLGGITIDCSNIQGGGGMGGGAAFNVSGRADTDNGLYWPVSLDVRNVTIVGAGGTAFNGNSYAIITLRNTLVTGFNTAVSVGDNDSDQAGVAHVYNSTLVGDVSVGGPVYLYNSIVTGGVNIHDTANDPSYRYCYVYSSFVGGYGGLGGRFSADGGTIVGGSAQDMFIDAANGDYRLADRAVAINRGNNDYVMTLAPTHADAEVDLNGNLRVVGGSVDMGCYERASIADFPSAVVTTAEDVVDPTDGLISLREALAYAQQGSGLIGNTVTFSSELAGETIHLDSPISISRDVSFNGGANDITIDAGQNGSAFEINVTSVQANVPDVYIRNLTITGGRAVNGGAINITSGNVYLDTLTIWGNEATKYGGAVYAYDSELTIVNSRIGGNTATYYGGVVNEFGKTVLRDSYVAENVGTNVNATADIWGKAAVNYVNSKNNVVGSVADNITLYDGVNNNRVGTKETPLKPFVSAATGNLEVLPEFVVNQSASVLDDAFETFVEEDLDIELSVLDDDVFGEF